MQENKGINNLEDLFDEYGRVLFIDEDNKLTDMGVITFVAFLQGCMIYFFRKLKDKASK